ncbi:MAG: Hpt domain-containing protein [bacterium]|jgi:HPt (histidine-containing phosphotransfer) domain-containing protein|nr:Hpt domain-containing protein [bacterium]
MQSPPIFSPQEAMSHIGANEIFLVEIIDQFLKDSPSQIAKLEYAVQEREYPVICKLAHALKCSISNFVALPAIEAAEDIEFWGTQRNPNKVEKALAHFQEVIHELNAALLQYKKNFYAGKTDSF